MVSRPRRARAARNAPESSRGSWLCFPFCPALSIHPRGACRRGESLKITLENNPRPSNQPCLSSKQELVGWRREGRGFGGTRTTALLSLSRTESPSPAVLGLQCQGGQSGEDPARRGQGLREGWGCSMSGSVTWSCGSRGTALRSQSVTGKNLPGWGKAGDEESRQSSRESAVSHLAPKETCPSGEHPPRSGTPVLQAGVGKKGCRSWAGPQTGSRAWGQGVTAAYGAITPGAGLASQLGGICFSPLTTSSWGQFMGIRGFIILPDTARSLRSRSLPWGERD